MSLRLPKVPLGRRCQLTIEARRTVKGTKPPPKPTSRPKTTKGTQKTKSKPGKPKQSAISSFVQRTPVLRNFTDGALLLGDMVMIGATEISSERIPLENMPMLTGVMIATWVLSAAAMGDYRGGLPTSENWYLSMLGPVFQAVVNACLTWGISVIAAVGVFSLLVSGNLIDPEPLVRDLTSENLSPQLEVAIAALITMSCWRGIAARLRYCLEATAPHLAGQALACAARGPVCTVILVLEGAAQT